MLQITSLALDWVPAGKHTSEDLKWIENADEAQPTLDRIPLLQIDHALRQNKMQLFRLVPGPGVLLTEIRSNYGVKRLSLLRGAGRAAGRIKSIMRLLGQTANEWGCECVETVVYSERLKRALELSGAEVEGFAMTFRPERHDGR